MLVAGRGIFVAVEVLAFAAAGCAPRADAPPAHAAPAPVTEAAPTPTTTPSMPVDEALPPEPKIPAACATLKAAKVSQKGILAEADELRSDAARIQTAIDACAPGQAVRLVRAGEADAFLSGPLSLRAGVALWVDEGVTLFASRNPRDFDVVPGKPTCGTNANNDNMGCLSLVNVNGVAGAAVVGKGTLDGRGGEPMLGGNLTWWDVAQDAKVKEIKHSNPRIIDVRKAKDFTLYGVTLHDSPKFHVGINSEGFVVWGVKVLTPARPQNSQGRPLTPFYARNTDGIDPSSASNGVIAYSEISVGDDQIAIKGGSAGPTRNLIIAHNRFGSGHGMSIGSETHAGVSNVKVYDLTIDGDVEHGGAPDVDLNGIRIKSDASRGGLVENIRYSDVCIRDVPNAIILTPHYSRATGEKIPVYKNISFNDVFVVRGSKPEVTQRVTLLGWDAENSLTATLSGVYVEGVQPEHVQAAFADVTLGPGPVNFMPKGDKVVVRGQAQTAPPQHACAEKFASKVR